MNDAEKLKDIEAIIDPVMPEATREQLGEAIIAIASILHPTRAFRRSPKAKPAGDSGL